MQCPVCQSAWLPKRCWSPTQWTHWNAVCQSPDGRHFNCCNSCSPEYWVPGGRDRPEAEPSRDRPEAEPSPRPPPSSHSAPPPQAGWTNREIRFIDFDDEEREAILYLRQIPWQFWDKFDEAAKTYGKLPRTRELMLSCSKADPNWPEKPTGIKFLSYFGAVRWSWHFPVQSARPDYICPVTGEWYSDAGHWVYATMIRFVWPECLAGRNEASLEDVVEAFLGFAYLKLTFYPHTASPYLLVWLNKIVEAIERLCQFLWNFAQDVYIV